jgi:hypothetical protein
MIVKPRARHPWTQVTPVTLSGIAKSRRVPNSAVRRYFNSPHEVLLAEGWARWSNRVCASLRESGAMSPSRVTAKLANGPVAGTLFCGLLANLRLHLEHAVDLDRVVEIRRTSACRNVARGCARAGVAGAGTLARTKPPCGRLIGGSIMHQPVDTRLLLNRPNGKS